MSRRAALVFNPVAGGAASISVEEIERHLRDHFELDRFDTTQERDADACAREAIERGASVVIAAGGDGTTSMVASALVGRDVVLGVLPCGTSNSVAEALGIPDDLEAACAVIAGGITRELDTARVGETTMVEMCSIGFHAETIGGTSRPARQRWGVFAYIASGLKQLLDLEAFEVELETESHRVSCEVSAVTIANLAPPKTVVAQGPSFIRPDDGLLDVTLVAATGVLEAVAAGLHLFQSAKERQPARRDRIGYFPVRQVRVTTREPRKVVVDGEIVGTTPVEIVCLPRSLCLLVPEAPPAEDGPPEADVSGLPGAEVEAK
ncbi:MAG TPA: YegS/Rv2252/BmrU family lipid kinase [Kofleriaceae bacterium]|nr:YegS/Rv2252/BmrU family lipid kinase [Kofleriaceae bacterium]